MDQSTYLALSGKTLTSAQAANLETLSSAAQDTLERLLGWPLDPSDWDNQYLEIGKTKNVWSCPDLAIDDEQLDPPDTVIGKTRLFRWKVNQPYLLIDPATTIHAVKLVNQGVTYHSFDTRGDYREVVRNGKTRVTYGLQWQRTLKNWMFWAVHRQPCYCWNRTSFDIAIDADWAYAKDTDEQTTLPMDIQRAWAKLITADMFTRNQEIKSEAVLGHSYTYQTPVDQQKDFASDLLIYAGPNGTLAPMGLV